ncbi:hypothetical protein [Brachybacterium sp. p3-SID957]|uniref:hypothetical protein n=1 Tax=Brachybacterium sp. p3-SID957 TaxID=2916049 RepID=UPI00223C4331|nr:hypothetical protein [Brachybacterium sp. p3-SID957]MCT1775482.1 hypothetical protein [Brachybacterium sp. p3-SID957]
MRAVGPCGTADRAPAHDPEPLPTPGFNESITRDQVIESASSSPPEYHAYRYYSNILD